MKKHLCLMLMFCICLVWGCEKAPESQSSAPAEESKEVSVQTEESVPEESAPAESDTVSCSNSEITVTIKRFDGWEYTVTEAGDDGQHGSISFNPEGEKGGVIIQLHAMPGLCGTGLFSEECTVAGYDAIVSTYYESHAAWDYITLNGYSRKFYMECNAIQWSAEYEEEIFEILDTLVVELNTDEVSQ